jgi:hypothetical protein
VEAAFESWLAEGSLEEESGMEHLRNSDDRATSGLAPRTETNVRPTWNLACNQLTVDRSGNKYPSNQR